MQFNRKYILLAKNHSFTRCLPRSEAPNCSKFMVTDIREKPVEFFYDTARVSTLAPEIILLTEVSLQKFPFMQKL